MPNFEIQLDGERLVQIARKLPMKSDRNTPKKAMQCMFQAPLIISIIEKSDEYKCMKLFGKRILRTPSEAKPSKGRINSTPKAMYKFLWIIV